MKIFMIIIITSIIMKTITYVCMFIDCNFSITKSTIIILIIKLIIKVLILKIIIIIIIITIMIII